MGGVWYEWWRTAKPGEVTCEHCAHHDRLVAIRKSRSTGEIVTCCRLYRGHRGRKVPINATCDRAKQDTRPPLGPDVRELTFEGKVYQIPRPTAYGSCRRSCPFWRARGGADYACPFQSRVRWETIVNYMGPADWTEDGKLCPWATPRA